MYNLIKKKIFFKKIFFNTKISIKKKKIILSVVKFFLKNNNYFINFIFLNNKNFFFIKNKFKITNCDNKLIVFNNNYGNLLIRNFYSDIFINYKLVKNCFLKTIFHSIFHLMGYDHIENRDYNFMVLIYNKLLKFLKRNK